MKVEFIKPGAGYGLGYHVGEVGEVEDSLAKQLIESNVAIPAKEVKVEKAESKAKAEKSSLK